MSTRPKRRGRGVPPSKVRTADYRNLRNPFPAMDVVSPDRIAALHEAALDVVERLGIKVLLPAARATFKAGGARVDDDTGMVYVGRDMIEAALATAPRLRTQ